MDFVLWVCRVMHVVSVVVWIGGLIFLNAILGPVAEYEGTARSATMLGTQKRFLPFIWSSLWILLVTGTLLMLLSPRFIWFEYSTLWSRLLALKQAAFLFLAFFSWQAARVFSTMERAANGEGEEFDGWRLGFRKLVRRAITAGLIALMAAGGMAVV